MTECRRTEAEPKLDDTVRAAMQALMELDADRLEDLAASCRSLHWRMEQGDRVFPSIEAARAKRELAVLDRLLAMTRENLWVVRQRQSLGRERTDYRGSLVPPWSGKGGICGDD